VGSVNSTSLDMSDASSRATVSFLAVPNLDDSGRLPALISVICSISSVSLGMLFVRKYQGVDTAAEAGVLRLQSTHLQLWTH